MPSEKSDTEEGQYVQQGLVLSERGELVQQTPEQAEHVRKLGLLVKAVRKKFRRAPNTLRTYEWAWGHFSEFCAARGLQSLPADPATVELYLTASATGLPFDETIQSKPLARINMRTLVVLHAAISDKHLEAKHPSPTHSEVVKSVMKTLRQMWREDPNHLPKKKEALRLDSLRSVIPPADADSLIALRDRALLLVGYAGALRRSELTDIHVEHLQWHAAGLVIVLPKTKGDREGKGAETVISYGNPKFCPVRSLRQWLDVSGITEGPVFRGITRGRSPRVFAWALGPEQVARIVKRRLLKAGFSEELVEKFAGHSLRRGLATDAAAKGARIEHIQKRTRHKSVQMVQEYINDAKRFAEDPITQMLNSDGEGNKP